MTPKEYEKELILKERRVLFWEIFHQLPSKVELQEDFEIDWSKEERIIVEVC